MGQAPNGFALAQRCHELACAFQAVAAEGAEQLLRAVGDEDDADGNAQGQRAEAGIGGQQALETKLRSFVCTDRARGTEQTTARRHLS